MTTVWRMNLIQGKRIIKIKVIVEKKIEKWLKGQVLLPTTASEPEKM